MQKWQEQVNMGAKYNKINLFILDILGKENLSVEGWMVTTTF